MSSPVVLQLPSGNELVQTVSITTCHQGQPASQNDPQGLLQLPCSCHLERTSAGCTKTAYHQERPAAQNDLCGRESDLERESDLGQPDGRRIHLSEAGMQALVTLGAGDMRRTLNIFQVCSIPGAPVAARYG